MKKKVHFTPNHKYTFGDKLGVQQRWQQMAMATADDV